MSTSTIPTIDQLLTSDLNRYERLLYRDHVDELVRGYRSWRKDFHREIKQRSKQIPRRVRQRWLEDVQAQWGERRDPANANTRKLFDYLKLASQRQFEQLEELARRHSAFRRSLAQAPTDRERQRLVLQYAGDLGASRSQLRGDARAFRRWFSDDAVADRYARRRGETEQRLAFCLQRLGSAAARIVQLLSRPDELPGSWQRLGVEPLVHEALDYSGDERVHVAALRSLQAVLKALPQSMARQVVSDRTLAFVDRTASNRQTDVWLQCEALNLLEILEPSRLEEILQVRLERPDPGDDIFVRRRAVRLVGSNLAARPTLQDLLPHVARDASPFVRQELIRIVWHSPSDVALPWIDQLARKDVAPQVRAAALAAALCHVARPDLQLPFLQILRNVIATEADTFVTRTALHVAATWLDTFLVRKHDEGDATGTRSVSEDSSRMSSLVDASDHKYKKRPREHGEGEPGTAPTHLADSANSARRAARSDDRASILKYYQSHILPAVRKLQGNAESVPVRRWAAQAAERMSCRLDPQATALAEALRKRTSGLRPGKSRYVPRRLLRGYSEDTIGRVMAVLAQEDFGYDLEKCLGGYRITRGPVFGLRLWRLMYELFRPSTDKRQAFRHTIGRMSDATIRAPSGVMGELSETKVPGEPLFIASEGSWRPYLPLVDDFVSVLNLSLFRSPTVRFFSSEGVTEVAAPRGPLARLIAAFRLTTGFAGYAQLRNWDDDAQTAPHEYLQAMQKLGFRIQFRPYADAQQPLPGDASLKRFFPCVLAVVDPRFVQSVQSYFSDYAFYFTSAFENSLTHLLTFAVGFLGFFVVRHWLSNWTLRRSRRRIPISIGGWGTRGKSGTERLKAALLNALGFGLISKTTGCEAMFLHCDAHGELLELPLFRPYDKATIWEHRNIIRLASRLRPSAFLWECMGLTPSYVDVLQRQWTRDDLATITNAYPDHEDLQGPAGFNVAQVISGFVPRRARVLTSEQQMRPLIEESCRRAGTTMRRVGWLESGLITDDILARFPYEEHPDNVALVLALADEIGCDRDFALKAMADQMVPDLGVLKTYPTANVHGRRLEFTNGMSANERFGCLGNWTRLGFDKHDPATEPGVWISTVVNNRADRVARSRVFAKILVEDIQVDRHFLIGGNLKGLQGYIWEAWDERYGAASVWSDGGKKDDAHRTLVEFAQRLRQPTDDAQIRAALQALLNVLPAHLPRDDGFDPLALLDLWSQPERLGQILLTQGLDESFVQAIQSHVNDQLRGWKEYRDLAQKIEQAGATERQPLDDEFRRIIRGWFARKLVVVENYDTTGEQIIRRICQETPVGYLNRVMGLQNIKGTGLDFVYRWQAWDACHAACRMLGATDAATLRRGLQTLAAFTDYGQLCEKHLRDTVEQVRRSPAAQREEFQAELDGVIAKLDRAMQDIHKTLQTATTRRRGVVLEWALGAVEEFMDVNDAVRRRKKADRIYQDLQAGRISRQAAIAELRALNKRQKGGWLAAALNGKS